MEALNNTKLNTVTKILTLSAMAVMLLICFTVYKADVSNFAIFVLFIIFYMQLPGLCVLRLMKIHMAHISTTMVLGLFTGWATVIIQYFITELIHTNILLYVLGPILSILWIVSTIHSGGLEFNFSFSRLSTAFVVFFGLALLYSLLNNQYIYLSPKVSDFIYINPDKGYHMGLINSLSHGWPLVSPWVQGRIIHYHVFTEIMYSVPVRLFGIPADTLLLSCGPFLTTYAFCSSLYSVFREFTAKPKRAGLYCLILLLSNIFIAKGPDDSLAFFFVFRNENATGFGISCMFALIILFRYWYDSFRANEKFLMKLLILTVFIMLLTGLKGPMGLVMIGAIWGTYVIGRIMRKVSAKTVLPILLITAGFLIIYIFILGSKGQSNGSGTSIFAFATVADIAFYKPALVAMLKSFGLPKLIRLSILLVVFTTFTLTAFLVPFTVGYIREIFLVFSGRKNYDFTRVMIYAACFVGFICMFLLNYSGHSQVYFGYVAIFLVPLISIWFLEDTEANKIFPIRVVKVIFIVMLVLSSFTLMIHYAKMIGDAVDCADNRFGYSRYKSISSEEYSAMVWIRNNTPEDALLATDRYYSESLDTYSYQDRWANCFFLYPVYSNRMCYIAGSGYNLPGRDWVIRKKMIETNNSLYQPDNVNRGTLAREIGVNYIVVSKDFTKIPTLENDDYRLCFSNGGVDIYEIKQIKDNTDGDGIL